MAHNAWGNLHIHSHGRVNVAQMLSIEIKTTYSTKQNVGADKGCGVRGGGGHAGSFGGVFQQMNVSGSFSEAFLALWSPVVRKSAVRICLTYQGDRAAVTWHTHACS